MFIDIIGKMKPFFFAGLAKPEAPGDYLFSYIERIYMEKCRVEIWRCVPVTMFEHSRVAISGLWSSTSQYVPFITQIPLCWALIER